MKTLKGTVVEVGNCENSDGESLGIGAYLDVEGSMALWFVPLTEEEARTFGGLLYESVTITIATESK